jgi:uncharacterized protein YndB with AHSA1/START domain
MPNPVDVTTPSDREITVTRSFDAPRTLIWDCHTRPELMRRWLLGPPGWTMPVCEVDLRVGGAYRFVWRNEDGRELVSHGEHREIAAPGRLVTTETMQGFDGASVNTLLLREEGGRTILTLTMLFPTAEIRDGALQSGMADGMAASYDRIQEIADEQKVG